MLPEVAQLPPGDANLLRRQRRRWGLSGCSEGTPPSPRTASGDVMTRSGPSAAVPGRWRLLRLQQLTSRSRPARSLHPSAQRPAVAPGAGAAAAGAASIDQPAWVASKKTEDLDPSSRALIANDPGLEGFNHGPCKKSACRGTPSRRHKSSL